MNSGIFPYYSQQSRDLVADLLGRAAKKERVNLIAIGDSRTAQNHFVTTGVYRMAKGALTQAQIALNERFAWKLAYNLGSNGATTQSIRDARTTTTKALFDKLRGQRNVVVFWAGVNSILADQSSATMMGHNSTTFKYLLQDMGVEHIYVIGEPPLPYAYDPDGAGGAAAQTPVQHAARTAVIKTYNAALQAFCAARAGRMTFVDIYSAMQGDTDIIHADYFGVDIHQNTRGAIRIGADILAPVIEQRYGRGSWDYTIPSVWLNESMEGAAGGNGAGGTLNGTNGGLPDLTYLASNGNSSPLTVDRLEDGAVQFTINGSVNGNSTFSLISAANIGGLMPGDILQPFLECEIVSCANLGGVYLRMSRVAGGATFTWPNSETAAGAHPHIEPYKKGRVIIAGDPFEVGSVADTFQPDLRAVFSGGLAQLVLKVWNAGLKRVYTSPIQVFTASGTLDLIRTIANCATTGAAITVTLPPLADVADGAEREAIDTDGNAATNNITLKGNGAEIILGAGGAANTKLITTAYGRMKVKASRYKNAWEIVAAA